MKKKFAFLVLSLALFTSCATHKYSQINHSKFYQEDYPDNVFKTNVFNSNDSISELFVQVDINTLAVLSGISRAEVLNNFVLDYSLVEGNKEKEVIQVGRINLFDSPDQSEFYKSFKIRLKTKTLGAFVLFSSIENKTKSKVYTSYYFLRSPYLVYHIKAK